ncbi:MAG: TRAP transporter small permease [Pseudomonadota bacterium]
MKRLESFLFLLSGASLLSSVGLAFAAVVMRYGFSFSLEWVEEAARYLAILAALLVAGPVLRNNGHIALDLLPSALHGRRLAIHKLALGSLTLLVSTATCIWGYQLTAQTFRFGMRTGSLQFPQWLPYSILPLSMAILALFSLVIMIEAVQNFLKAGTRERDGEESNQIHPTDLDDTP